MGAAWKALKAASSSALTGGAAASRLKGATSGVLDLSLDCAGGWLWAPRDPWLPCAMAMPQAPSSNPVTVNISNQRLVLLLIRFCSCSILVQSQSKAICIGHFLLESPFKFPDSTTIYGRAASLSFAKAARPFCAACLASSGPPSTARADAYSALATEALPS